MRDAEFVEQGSRVDMRAGELEKTAEFGAYSKFMTNWYSPALSIGTHCAASGRSAKVRHMKWKPLVGRLPLQADDLPRAGWHAGLQFRESASVYGETE